MTVTFRPARRDDVAAIVELLRDDPLGQNREAAEPSTYLAAFDAMETEPGNRAYVGEDAAEIVATYQMTIITGLSLGAARRAQIEGVRVAAHRRGEGLGRAMFLDAETRARAAGARLMQLTSNLTRSESAKIYERLGFLPTHTGFKRAL